MNCKEKVSYKSENHARKARVAVYKQRNVRLRVYLCRGKAGCFGWHLTSAPNFVKGHNFKE